MCKERENKNDPEKVPNQSVSLAVRTRAQNVTTMSHPGKAKQGFQDPDQGLGHRFLLRLSLRATDSSRLAQQKHRPMTAAPTGPYPLYTAASNHEKKVLSSIKYSTQHYINFSILVRYNDPPMKPPPKPGSPYKCQHEANAYIDYQNHIPMIMTQSPTTANPVINAPKVTFKSPLLGPFPITPTYFSTPSRIAHPTAIPQSSMDEAPIIAMPVVSICLFEIDAPLIHSTSAPIAYSTDVFVPSYLFQKKKKAHPTQAPSTIDSPIMLWRSLLAAADFNICATLFRSINDENSQSALERLSMNLQEKLSSFWVGLHCLSHQINVHKIGTPLLVPYQSITAEL